MASRLRTLLSPTAPADYKPIPRNVISLFLTAVPCLMSILILKLVPLNIQNTTSDPSKREFQLSPNSTHMFGKIIEWPPTLFKIGAIQVLPAPFMALLTCDHPTNECFMFPKKAQMSLPFIANAGGANDEAHAASLLRPGISAIELHSCGLDTCTVIVARHAARDIAQLTLQYHEHTFYPSYTIKSFASTWNSTRLNSPNSLAIDVRGNLFFSDAYFGLVESIDVFDRKLDEPPGANLSQSVYYIPASDLHSIQLGQLNNVEPIRLIENVDRPSGVAVTMDNRLLVAEASPRQPCLKEYVLESHVINGQEILVAKDPVVLYNWTSSLHNWEQSYFSGVLGNLVLDEKNRLYVGVSDGVAVFDVSQRCTGEVSPTAWIKAAVKPGPALVSYERGVLYVAASSKAATVEVL